MRAELGLRVCRTCGARLPKLVGQQRPWYCSDDCRRVADRVNTRASRQRCRARGYRKRPRPDTVPEVLSRHTVLSASDVGALSEILVVADLTRAGLQVFRAVSPGASCDMLVVDGHQLWRVEVKTCSKSRRGGGWRFDHQRLRPERYDVLALVKGDTGIEYRPNPWKAQ